MDAIVRHSIKQPLLLCYPACAHHALHALMAYLGDAKIEIAGRDRWRSTRDRCSDDRFVDTLISRPSQHNHYCQSGPLLIVFICSMGG